MGAQAKRGACSTWIWVFAFLSKPLDKCGDSIPGIAGDY